MKSLFIPTPTYTMLEFIARKSGKGSVTKYLEALAIQEYSIYQDKPFYKGVVQWRRRLRLKGNMVQHKKSVSKRDDTPVNVSTMGDDTAPDSSSTPTEYHVGGNHLYYEE